MSAAGSDAAPPAPINSGELQDELPLLAARIDATAKEEGWPASPPRDGPPSPPTLERAKVIAGVGELKETEDKGKPKLDAKSEPPARAWTDEELGRPRTTRRCQQSSSTRRPCLRLCTPIS